MSEIRILWLFLRLGSLMQVMQVLVPVIVIDIWLIKWGLQDIPHDKWK